MIYVIGAGTGVDNRNRDAFEEVRLQAMAEHPLEDVVIPHDSIPGDATWTEAMRESIRTLCDADVVYVVMDQYLELSVGCTVELAVARALNLPVRRVEVNGL